MHTLTHSDDGKVNGEEEEKNIIAIQSDSVCVAAYVCEHEKLYSSVASIDSTDDAERVAM